MGNGRISRRLKTSLICPIHKKGNKQDRNNNRGIALLNVVYKEFSNCFLTRIQEKAEQTIGEYQGGFRPGKSTTDQIFIIRQLYQKMWEFDREIHKLFVYFKKSIRQYLYRLETWALRKSNENKCLIQ